MPDSRYVVERLIPIRLVWETIWNGVADRDEHSTALEKLREAEHIELKGLTRHQQETVERHARRAVRAIMQPYLAEQASCAKFGLIVFYAMQDLIQSGEYELVDGPFSEVMDAVLDPDGTVTEFANIDRLDASAQKHARRMLNAMHSLGYYQGRAAA